MLEGGMVGARRHAVYSTAEDEGNGKRIRMPQQAMETMMLWTLIGYFPKRRTMRSSWVSPYPDVGFPASEPVEEICSVSHCIAKGPELKAGEMPGIEFGGYDDPAAAWRAVAPGQRDDFD